MQRLKYGCILMREREEMGYFKNVPGKMFLGSMYQGKEYMASHVY